MPDMPMAADRLAPQDWIAEINRIVAATSSLNSEIRRQWNILKDVTPQDGVWHAKVQQLVAAPYNLLHGSWPSTTTVEGRTYKSLDEDHARGLPNWHTGYVMPKGYATLYGRFGKTTKGSVKGIWRGTYAGRGTNMFRNTMGTRALTLQHNNFEASTADRVWYTDLDPQTIYSVTDHVDTSRAGAKALADLTKDVTAWLDTGDLPIKAGFLDLEWAPLQLYVIT